MNILKPSNVLGDRSIQPIEINRETISKNLTKEADELDFYRTADDENKPRRKNPDNNLVFEMLSNIKNAKKEDKNLKDQENESTLKLSSRIFDDIENNLAKEEEKKSNSSFSLNFLQEQTQSKEKNLTTDSKNDSNAIKLDSNSNNDSMLSLSSTNSQTAKSKASSNFTIENLPEWIKQDAYVIVTTKTVMNKRGRIRFIGKTKFGNGIWIGVELEDTVGINDGSIMDVRYFTCPKNKGVFVRHDKLTLIENRDI